MADTTSAATITSTGHVLITSAGLSYRLTSRLRWCDGALQQCWTCVGTGPELWLPVPTVPPPEAA